MAKAAASTTSGCRGVMGDRVENGGCETGAPFEIVTMINRVGIVYLGGASPSTCTRPKLYFSRIRIRENGGEEGLRVGSRARGGPQGDEKGEGGTVTSHRYVCICRFQRVLIERTHAATLSCTLGEQYSALAPREKAQVHDQAPESEC